MVGGVVGGGATAIRGGGKPGAGAASGATSRAAPNDTLCFGSASSATGRSVASRTRWRINGMFDVPPTSRIPATSSIVMPADLTARCEASIVSVTRGAMSISNPIRRWTREGDSRGCTGLALDDRLDDGAQEVRRQRLRSIRDPAEEDRCGIAEAPLELSCSSGRLGQRPPFSGLADQHLAVFAHRDDGGDGRRTTPERKDAHSIGIGNRSRRERRPEVDSEAVRHRLNVAQWRLPTNRAFPSFVVVRRTNRQAAGRRLACVSSRALKCVRSRCSRPGSGRSRAWTRRC